MTRPMSITLFGIYCREDKMEVYFQMNGKSKRDLWPIIIQVVHADTADIWADAATQYLAVENIIPGAIHKSVNHKASESVSATDNANHTNSLENENKQMKNILCTRTD